MKNKRAFTLIEMVVSLTVFTVIVTIASNIYVTAARGQRRANLEAAIYNESRSIIDKIAREIRYKTIDYDEYYNQNIIAFEPSSTATYYGGNFGEYSKNFYDPGYHFALPTQPDRYGKNEGYGKRGDLGAQCNNASGLNGPTQSPPCPAGSVILKESLDKNTGRNSWNEDVAANAFCDDFSSNKKCYSLTTEQFKGLHENEELYLIDYAASEKTIIALENNQLAILKLVGSDNDIDGINETWACHPDFNCQGFDPSKKNHYREDLIDSISDKKFFVPITPSTVKISSLKFIVSPLEDPRRAFAENSDDVQIQPQVIIEMVLSPADEVLVNYPDIVPEIRIRTAVSSRINGAIKSYDPDK